MNETLKAQVILDALNTFKKKMVDAGQLRSAINQSFDIQLRNLREAKEQEKQYELEALPRSVDNMFYYDLKSGHAVMYGSKRLFLDQQVTAAHLHKNRQYQWVLVDSYEAFEDFLEHIYAAMGWIDLDFWPMSDYRNVQTPEIPAKPFEWYQTQLKQKKNKPGSILNVFRTKFQELKKIETDNECNLHAVFELTLISKLRHLVVHTSGKVENKEEVVKRMLNEAAINDKHKESLTARANFFFNNLRDLQDVHVYLLGHTNPDLPFCSTHNLSDLMGFLVSYAQLITEISIGHLHQKGLIANIDEDSD